MLTCDIPTDALEHTIFTC